MSSVVKTVTEIFRSHLISAGRVEGLKSCVAALAKFHQSSSIETLPTFPAALQIAVATDATTPGTNYGCFVGSILQWGKSTADCRRVRNADRKWQLDVVRTIPMNVWCNVLPWEICRGLSGVPRRMLMPAPPPAPPSEPDPLATLPALSEPTIPGMLFVPREVDRGQPARYWSGGIQTPIDVAFLARNDAIVLPSWKRDMRSASPQPQAVTLISSFGHLDPLPDVDSVEADRIMRMAITRNAKAKFRAESTSTSVDYVLETASGFFDSLIESTFEGEPFKGSVPPAIQISLHFSDELLREVRDKLVLQSEFIFGLECRIERALRESNRYLPPKPGTVYNFQTVRRELGEIDYELVANCYKLGLAGGPIVELSKRLYGEVSSGAAPPEKLEPFVELCKDRSVDFYPIELARAVKERAELLGIW